MEQKVCDAPRSHAETRYALEAYDFFCDAVTYTQEMLGRLPQEGDHPRTDYHISAGELCRGACELAVQEYGLMAWIVFKMWGVTSTTDMGGVIFHLIEVDRLSKSDRDDPSDFHDLFDLESTLASHFEWANLTQKRKGKR